MNTFQISSARPSFPSLQSAFVLVGLLSCLAAVTCFSVFAATQPDLEEMIQDKISQRHPTDTPAWWQALGPEAPKTIMELYEKDVGIYERTRLLSGLSNFHDPDSVAFLKKQAENSQQDVLRNSSIQAIGSAGSAADVEFLGKFLDHDDPQTRVAAGKALKKINDARGNALLQKYYAKESLPWVRERIQEYSPNQLGSKGPLLRMASKEPVALKAEFSASWKGVLIIPSLHPSISRAGSNTGPNTGPSAGLTRLDAQAKTQIENVTSLTGEVSFQLPPSSQTSGQTAGQTAEKTSGAASKTITLQLSQVSGRDTRVSGWLKGDILKEWGAKEGSLHFDGELMERGEVRLFKVESREILLTLILRSN